MEEQEQQQTIPAEKEKKASSPLEDERSFISINLVYDQENGVLLAELSLTDKPVNHNLDSLLQKIKDEDYKSLSFVSGALEEVVKKASCNETGRFELARRKEKSGALEFVSLVFEFDEADTSVYAVLAAADEDKVLNEEAVKRILQESGFDKYFWEPVDLKTLLERIAIKQVGRFKFAESRDAGILIELSEDSMKALVSTTPAYGGSPLTKESVLDALADMKIDPRFYTEAAVEDLLARGPVENFLFAEGKPSEDGKDSIFIPLVQEVISKDLAQDQVVDFHDLNEFVVVEEGAPLMRREPHTLGVNGCDLLGRSVPAKVGKEKVFEQSHAGAVFDPGDENLLIAEIKGHPIVSEKSVRVDPVLYVQDVGLKTGDINFDGSVNIDGEVMAGMVVEATGDINVKGIVEKATLIAGGSISIGGGVIGGELSKEEKEKLETGELDPEERARSLVKSRLKAGGRIKAQFISMAEVICQEDLVLREYALHCVIQTDGEVLIGQQGGKGCLIGGYCHAKEGVKVNLLGSDASVRTYVSVGESRDLVQDFKNQTESRTKHVEERKQLEEVLKKLLSVAKQSRPDAAGMEKIKRVSNAVKQLGLRLNFQNKQLEELAFRIREAKKATIVTKIRVYSNVHLAVNGLHKQIKFREEGGRFKMDAGTIVKTSAV